MQSRSVRKLCQERNFCSHPRHPIPLLSSDFGAASQPRPAFISFRRGKRGGIVGGARTLAVCQDLASRRLFIFSPLPRLVGTLAPPRCA